MRSSLPREEGAEAVVGGEGGEPLCNARTPTIDREGGEEEFCFALLLQREFGGVGDYFYFISFADAS